MLEGESDKEKLAKEEAQGDTFLVSLLQESIQSNQNNIKSIQTDFFIKQKKEFQYSKWKGEIGGDICKTDIVYLNDGHAYTVFMNGDAMGKSVQGAVGAIVLGVIFEALLVRAKKRRRRNYNVFPEIWLKEAFLDMQSVFQSFDGSMFATVCLGLIHAETGILYYINAEHPRTAIYSEGKAFYIEETSGIFKLGTPIQDELFSIKVYYLKDGDEIYIGSDGKDDLMDKVTGRYIFDLEESVFLEAIEKSKGDLNEIYEFIQTKGNIRDDFSLLRIQYSEKFKEKLKSNPTEEFLNLLKEANFLISKNNFEETMNLLLNLENSIKEMPELSKILGKIYYDKKEYLKSVEFYDIYNSINPDDNLYIVSKYYSEVMEILAKTYIGLSLIPLAIECLEEYLYINPSNDELLYMLSLLYRQTNLLEKAADAGERLFLRQPNHIRNLVNLSQIYILSKVQDRAVKIIKIAIDLQPDNPELVFLYEKVNSM